MDAFIVLVLALGILIFHNPPDTEADLEYDRSKKVKSVEYEDREMKLNDGYYEDPDAFMEMAHALGFRNGE